MCRTRSIVWALTVCGAALQAGISSAQQVQITAPYQQLHDSFYENFGVNWGLSGRNRNGGGFFFNTGAGNSAPPPFGGWDPAADARFGGGISGGGMNFGFGISAGTGSSRTNTVESPTIVLPNGGSGGLFSGSQRPFVTGIIPVVGDGVFNGQTPGVRSSSSSISPLQERLVRLQQGEAVPQARHQPPRNDPDVREAAEVANREEAPLVLRGNGSGADRGEASRPATGSSGGSTANHGDISVAEIRRLQTAQEATRDAELLERLEKARSYEEAGKSGIAKVYYQQAAARASGELKQQLLEKIQLLSQSGSR